MTTNDPRSDHTTQLEPHVELIAHRAANTSGTVPAAAAVADAVELDVHSFRRTLEVRHAKVIWPTRIQWDKWWVRVSPDRPPSFREILDEVPPGTGLWLDLKGFSPRLTRAALRSVADRDDVTVSSRSWWILGPARSAGRRTMRSVGSRWQLWTIRRLGRRRPADGIVIGDRLLVPGTLDDLRSIAPAVVVWGVTDLDRAEQLGRSGVRGLIVDDLDLISAIRGRATNE